LDNVLTDLQPVGRNCTISQQGVNGVLPYVGVSHFVQKNFAHLSPSLNHETPDFFLQLISSMSVDLSNSLTTPAFPHFLLNT
jgi:hypothetical protein